MNPGLMIKGQSFCWLLPIGHHGQVVSNGCHWSDSAGGHVKYSQWGRGLSFIRTSDNLYQSEKTFNIDRDKSRRRAHKTSMNGYFWMWLILIWHCTFRFLLMLQGNALNFTPINIAGRNIDCQGSLSSSHSYVYCEAANFSDHNNYERSTGVYQVM